MDGKNYYTRNEKIQLFTGEFVLHVYSSSEEEIRIVFDDIIER